MNSEKTLGFELENSNGETYKSRLDDGWIKIDEALTTSSMRKAAEG